MKILLSFLKIIGIIAFVALLIWVITYFTVPEVKDWTNTNIFKIETHVEDEEVDIVDPFGPDIAVPSPGAFPSDSALEE